MDFATLVVVSLLRVGDEGGQGGKKEKDTDDIPNKRPKPQPITFLRQHTPQQPTLQHIRECRHIRHNHHNRDKRLHRLQILIHIPILLHIPKRLSKRDIADDVEREIRHFLAKVAGCVG
jgi:hypothetical protein